MVVGYFGGVVLFSVGPLFGVGQSIVRSVVWFSEFVLLSDNFIGFVLVFWCWSVVWY